MLFLSYRPPKALYNSNRPRPQSDLISYYLYQYGGSVSCPKEFRLQVDPNVFVIH